MYQDDKQESLELVKEINSKSENSTETGIQGYQLFTVEIDAIFDEKNNSYIEELDTITTKIFKKDDKTDTSLKLFNSEIAYKSESVDSLTIDNSMNLIYFSIFVLMIGVISYANYYYR